LIAKPRRDAHRVVSMGFEANRSCPADHRAIEREGRFGGRVVFHIREDLTLTTLEDAEALFILKKSLRKNLDFATYSYSYAKIDPK
jgi:hypothetical protein